MILSALNNYVTIQYIKSICLPKTFRLLTIFSLAFLLILIIYSSNFSKYRLSGIIDPLFDFNISLLSLLHLLISAIILGNSSLSSKTSIVIFVLLLISLTIISLDLAEGAYKNINLYFVLIFCLFNCLAISLSLNIFILVLKPEIKSLNLVTPTVTSTISTSFLG